MKSKIVILLILLTCSALADAASVKAFFIKAKPGYTLQGIRESEDWAFLGWTYGEAGGQALLHRWQGKWEIAVSGGGAMGAGELAKFGVPRNQWPKLLGYEISAEESAAAQETLAKPVWTWLTSDKTMTASDIEYDSALELTLMRNEIFAVHGRPFQDPYLKATFGMRDWYKPKSNYSPNSLTARQRANADFIYQYQKKTGKL